MTNKEASKNCERIKTYLSVGNPMWDASVIIETLDMAIKALEQPEPCEDEDAVSRSQLRLMKTEECAGHTIEYAMGWKACIEWIKTLPSVKPERKKGTWIKTGQSFVFSEKFRNYSCSECGYDIDKTKFNFCPNCGAEMEGQDE